MSRKQEAPQSAKHNRRRGTHAGAWRTITACLMALALLSWAARSNAQVLEAPWVQQTQDDIREHRMADVRVIVLDAKGQPAGPSTVSIKQQRLSFRLGVRLTPELLKQMRGMSLAEWNQPVWRAINHLGLDELTRWDRTEPAMGEADHALVEQALQLAESRGMTTRWGGVVSENIARVPKWIAPLHGPALQATVTDHAARTVQTFGRRVGTFDLITHRLDHRLLRERVGANVTRPLFQRTRAAGPEAQLFVRYEDALAGPRVRRMIDDVIDLRDRFIQIDGVAIEARFGGMVVQRPLARAMHLLHQLDLPIDIVDLEVGGPGSSATALNMETVLRRLFAEPAVRSITFGGLTKEHYGFIEPALINPAGKPTEAGLLLDKLFRELWWTDLEDQTDELGNLRTRVFLGSHRIEATLPDGARVWTEVYLPPTPPHGQAEHTVVLQPVRGE